MSLARLAIVHVVSIVILVFEKFSVSSLPLACCCLQAGRAIAATLLGRNNPAARLPTTWYSKEGLARIGDIRDYRMHPHNGTSASSHTPPQEQHQAAAHQAAAGQAAAGRTYRYHALPVLWPFGCDRIAYEKAIAFHRIFRSRLR